MHKELAKLHCEAAFRPHRYHAHDEQNTDLFMIQWLYDNREKNYFYYVRVCEINNIAPFPQPLLTLYEQAESTNNRD